VNGRILVVDDDAGVRYTLQEILRDAGFSVALAEHGEQALGMSRVEHFDLVISDLRMTPMDGLALLEALRTEQPRLRVILITAHGSERHAVAAMKLGAYDYFRKPFDLDELLAVVSRAIETVRLAEDNERLASEGNFAQSLVFRSKSMGRLALLAGRVAPRDVTVLILGESGTGKERVAEVIVRASKRAEKPFVRFNCATLATELAEAELFGHARGAFTGAERKRCGLFREAHQGTLLLDEIGELDLNLQAKLLRVLQDGEVRPVGEDRAVAVDVRIIAATHRDLGQLVENRRFREDLLYRLKVVTLEVPALRERRDDIALLARHFLQRYAERFGTGPLRVKDELFRKLEAHDWPGNVRELENTIEAMVALSVDGELDMTQLPAEISGKTATENAGRGAGKDATDQPTAIAPRTTPTGLPLKQRVEAYERGLIVTALETSGGNRQKAARILGLSRATLHDKLHRYGIVTRTDEARSDED
jgi:two-component system, NtrC family, response regulator HydG